MAEPIQIDIAPTIAATALRVRRIAYEKAGLSPSNAQAAAAADTLPAIAAVQASQGIMPMQQQPTMTLRPTVQPIQADTGSWFSTPLLIAAVAVATIMLVMKK